MKGNLKANNEKAIINCEYSMATFSTSERRRKIKTDRRSTEITLVFIKKTKFLKQKKR